MGKGESRDKREVRPLQMRGSASTPLAPCWEPRAGCGSLSRSGPRRKADANGGGGGFQTRLQNFGLQELVSMPVWGRDNLLLSHNL